PTGVLASTLGVLFALPAIWLLLFASGLIGEPFADEDEDYASAAAVQTKARQVASDPDDDQEDEDGGGFLGLGAIAHYWYIAQARMRRLLGIRPNRATFDQPYDFNEDEFGTLNEPVRPKSSVAGFHRVEPSLDGPSHGGAGRRAIHAPPMAHDD